MSDISGIVKSTGVDLEAQSLKTFGAAVENSSRGSLGKAFTSPDKVAPSSAIPDSTQVKNYIPGSSVTSDGGTPGSYNPTLYAATIASGEGGFNPKGKFLFKVGFRVVPDAASLLSAAGYPHNLTDLVRDLTFVVANIELPTVSYEYEEVNMYNFRTKVLKRIEFKDLSFSFLDNVANTGLNFVNMYMMSLSPITRARQGTGNAALDANGFSFSDNYGVLDTAYRGSLPGDNINLISEIFIEHFYVQTTESGSPLDSVKLNTFVFTNPRLNEFSTGSLDYAAGGDANTISMSVNFDSIYIETGKEGRNMQTPSHSRGDLLYGIDTVSASLPRGSAEQAGKTSNPQVGILTNQGQRAAQINVENAIGQKYGDSPGKGLASSVGDVNGALGQAASKTTKSVSSGYTNQINVSRLPLVSDNSVPGGAASQESSIDDAF